MNNELQVTKPIGNFVKAVNEHNSDAFLAAFTENAVITDEGHEYQGIATIREWNAEKNIGANITMSPIEITERNGKTVLTAEFDGNFDKTGLPDPFLMDLYFTHDENLISALEYRLAGK